MADFYGTKYTAANITKPGTNVTPADMGGRVRFMYDYFDFAAQTVADTETLALGTNSLPIGTRILSIVVRTAASIGGADLVFAVGGVSVGASGAISSATDTVVTCVTTVTTSQGYLTITVDTADADLSNAEFLVTYVID